MAKFVFALEALLEARKREEREQMKLVGRIEQERVALEERASALARAIVEERQQLRDALGSQGREGVRVDVSQVRMQANASLHHVRKTQQLALDGAAILGRLEKARARLLEATTRRRAVELLREKRYAAWLAQVHQKEMREHDELLTARYGQGGAQMDSGMGFESQD